MLIRIEDLAREPLEFDEVFSPDAIGYGELYTQIGNLHSKGRADLIEEHRGPREIISDIRLRAAYDGRIEVPCARCIDPVEHEVNGSFDLIFRPIGVDSDASEYAITASETEIGYYEGASLSLEDVLREQVLLSLPVRSLCRQNCKGLCPRCGQNLNRESCNCDSAPVDPRWTALGDLQSRLKVPNGKHP